MNQPFVAYLISRYPAISHTFILKEILHLKAKGFDIRTASINRSQRSEDKMIETELAESRQTLYVKDQGFKGFLKALGRTLFDRPGAFFKALWFAINSAGFDQKQSLFHCFYFVEAVIVADWLIRNDCKHLHVHFGSEVATVGIMVKQLTGCHLSLTIHGPDEFYNVDQYLLADKVTQADTLFCISDFARSQLMKVSDHKHWHKCLVTRLGVDTDEFTPQHGERADRPVILCVGRLCEAKAQQILVQAAQDLKSRGIDFSLVFVGDGPLRKSLELSVNESELNAMVTFTGAVDHAKVRDYYDQCDIFCLPSFAEGIPIVLMEAMAKEKAVVTTHITGIPELITHEVDGLLVPPSNAVALADALQRVIEDKALRDSLGKNGRKKVVAEYNLHTNMDRFAEKLRIENERAV